MVAFFIRLKLLRANAPIGTDARVLPSFYDDNYIHAAAKRNEAADHPLYAGRCRQRRAAALGSGLEYRARSDRDQRRSACAGDCLLIPPSPIRLAGPLTRPGFLA